MSSTIPIPFGLIRSALKHNHTLHALMVVSPGFQPSFDTGC